MQPGGIRCGLGGVAGDAVMDPIMAVCGACRKPRDKINEPEKSEHAVLEMSDQWSVRVTVSSEQNHRDGRFYYCTECGTVKYWPEGVPE